MAPHSPLLVAPFGAGRRICPGKRFVELALQLILAKVCEPHWDIKKENRNKLSELSRLFLLFGVHLDCSGIWDRCRGRTRLAVWVYSGAAKSCVARISGSWVEGWDDLNDFYSRFIGNGSSMNVNQVNEWSIVVEWSTGFTPLRELNWVCARRIFHRLISERYYFTFLYVLFVIFSFNSLKGTSFVYWGYLSITLV